MTGSTHFDLENEALETTTTMAFSKLQPSDDSADMNVVDEEEEKDEAVIQPPSLTTSSSTAPFLNPPPKVLKAEAVSRNHLIVTFSIPVVGPAVCSNKGGDVVAQKIKTPRQLDFEMTLDFDMIQTETRNQNDFTLTNCCQKVFREPPLLIGKAV